MKKFLRLALIALLGYGIWRTLGPVWGPVLAIMVTAVLLQAEIGAILVASLPWLRRQVQKQVLQPWQGRYYAFESRQVRFYLYEEAIWAAAPDVLALLQPPPDARELRQLGDAHQRLPGMRHASIRADALTRMITRRSADPRCSAHTIRLRNWWLKETLPNLERFAPEGKDN